ncbi:MAG: F-box protein, partial [Burkholderiales bacterium]
MQPSLTTNYSFLAATTSQSKNNLSKATDSTKASKSTSFFSASKLNDKEKYNQTTTNNSTNKNNPNNEKSTYKQQKTLPNADKPDPVSAKKSVDSVKTSESNSGTFFEKLKNWMGYESKVNYFRRDGTSMSLPEEMIFSILQLLNFKDLAVLAIVDKNCNDLVKSFLGFELGWFQIQEYPAEIVAYFRKLPADKIFDGDLCKERVLWRSYMSEYVSEFLDFSALDLQYDTSVFTREIILPSFMVTLCRPYGLHGVRLINEKSFLNWVNLNINPA